MTKIKCFNCNAKRHFAQDCLKPNKVFNYTKVNELYAAKCIFLTNSYPLRIIDLGVIDHVTKDKETFIEFQRMPHGAKCIYVGNNA